MHRVPCNGTAWLALAPSRLIGSKHLEWKKWNKWNKWKVSNRVSQELDTDPETQRTSLTAPTER